MLIGFITTTIAIVILFSSLLNLTIDRQYKGIDYFLHLLPRLTLSIFVELFSFFFLRLYKKNLDDIRYINNEITNIEMRTIAIKAALHNDNDDKILISNLLQKLADTERNFILKKDESTVELEHSKIEIASNKDLIEGIVKILDRQKIKAG